MFLNSQNAEMPFLALNVIAIRVTRHTNVSKQMTLLDGVDLNLTEW